MMLLNIAVPTIERGEGFGSALLIILNRPFSFHSPHHVAHRSRRRRPLPLHRPLRSWPAFTILRRGLYAGDACPKTLTTRCGPSGHEISRIHPLRTNPLKTRYPHLPLSSVHHACYHSNLRIPQLQAFSTRHIALRKASHSRAALHGTLSLPCAHLDPIAAQEAGSASAAHGRGRRVLIASSCLFLARARTRHHNVASTQSAAASLARSRR